MHQIKFNAISLNLNSRTLEYLFTFRIYFRLFGIRQLRKYKL